jgi:hypothetical protein
MNSSCGAISESVSQSSGCKRTLDVSTAEVSHSDGNLEVVSCAMDTSSCLPEVSETKRNKTGSDEAGTGMKAMIVSNI